MSGSEDVECRRDRCGHPYRRHAPGGAHCRVCDCSGFRWVDLDGPPVGSYAEAPHPITR